mmetsp:Transcript_212/g.481  ORF Transcript_212/g.481 Transcript_212/m.481 type:complete len:264 (+) Transcript_212:1747-2538(+)
MHSTGGKFDAFLGRNGRHQFVHDALDHLAVIRSGVTDGGAAIGCPYQHVGRDPHQLFEHGRAVVLRGDDVALEVEDGQAIRERLSPFASRGGKTLRIEGSDAIGWFHTLGRNTQVQQDLRVFRESLALQEVVQVTVLQKDEIFAPGLGAVVDDSVEGIVARGQKDGPLSVGIDGIPPSENDAVTGLGKGPSDSTVSDNASKRGSSQRRLVVAAAAATSKTGGFQQILFSSPLGSRFGSLAADSCCSGRHTGRGRKRPSVGSRD